MPDFDRGLALHRLKFWWMGPTIVRSHGGVPPETCFLMLNTADGSDHGECCLYMTVLQDWCRFWFVSEEGQLHVSCEVMWRCPPLEICVFDVSLSACA